MMDDAETAKHDGHDGGEAEHVGESAGEHVDTGVMQTEAERHDHATLIHDETDVEAHNAQTDATSASPAPGDVTQDVRTNQEPVDLDRMRADAEARVAASAVPGWPKTFHHTIHGAREFADPNDYALNGGGYAFETAGQAERARTPLEADIAYQKFLGRVHAASEVEPGTNRAVGNHLV